MRKIVKENLEPKTISPPALLKELRYFWMSMTSILLSLFFPVAEYQFLTLAIITGAKWIADSKSTGIVIIERGWKEW